MMSKQMRVDEKVHKRVHEIHKERILKNQLELHDPVTLTVEYLCDIYDAVNKVGEKKSNGQE